MTKEQLEKDRDDWKQQAQSLQDDIDGLNEYISELEFKNAELLNTGVYIKDLDNFKFKLRYSKQFSNEEMIKFEDFIDEYARYYNV
jgi:TolA-binding protein